MLHSAAKAGDRQLVLQLLDKGANINEIDKSAEGYTALHYAAEANQTETVRLLLQKGANPNPKTSDSGRTPLHLACLGNFASVVQVLLEIGADVNATDENGFSALDMASGPAVLQLLTKPPSAKPATSSLPPIVPASPVKPPAASPQPPQTPTPPLISTPTPPIATPMATFSVPTPTQLKPGTPTVLAPSSPSKPTTTPTEEIPITKSRSNSINSAPTTPLRSSQSGNTISTNGNGIPNLGSAVPSSSSSSSSSLTAPPKKETPTKKELKLTKSLLEEQQKLVQQLQSQLSSERERALSLLAEERQKKESFESQVRIVNVQVEYLTSTEAKLREDLKNLSDDKTKLLNTIQVNQNNAAAELSHSKAETQKVTEELTASRKQTAQKESELTSLRQKLADAESCLRHQEADRVRYDESRRVAEESSRKQIESLRSAFEEQTERKRKEFEEKMQKLSLALFEEQTAHAIAQKQSETLSAELATALEELTMVKEHEKELVAETEKHKVERTTLEEKVQKEAEEKWRVKFEELSQKEAQNALQLEEQIRSLQERLRAELDQQTSTTAALKKEAEERFALETEFHKLKMDLENVRDQSAAELEDRQKNLSDLSRKFEEVSASQAKTLQHEAELLLAVKNFEEIVSNSKKIEVSLREEVDSLRAHIETTQKSHEDELQKLHRNQEEDLKVAILSSEQQRIEALNRSAASEAQVKTMQQELDKYRKDMQQYEIAMLNTTSGVRSRVLGEPLGFALPSAAAAAAAEKETAQKTIAALKKENEDKDGEMVNLKKIIQQYLDDNQKLEAKYRELKERFDRALKEKVEQTEWIRWLTLQLDSSKPLQPSK